MFENNSTKQPIVMNESAVFWEKYGQIPSIRTLKAISAAKMMVMIASTHDKILANIAEIPYASNDRVRMFIKMHT